MGVSLTRSLRARFARAPFPPSGRALRYNLFSYWGGGFAAAPVTKKDFHCDPLRRNSASFALTDHPLKNSPSLRTHLNPTPDEKFSIYPG